MEASDFPAGTIIIQTNNLAKYTQSHISLMETQVPPGTTIRYSADGNLNNDLVQAQGEWAWFLKDDVAWESDLLLKLLEHDKHIVSPLLLDEVSPFTPLAYESIDEEGKYVPVNLSKHQPGLIETVGLGLTGMLVKKRVFEEISHPWFELGKINSQDGTEDLYFCQKARREGFSLWVDSSLSMTTISQVGISPLFYEDGKLWAVRIDVNGTGLVIPTEKIPEA